MSEMTAPRPWTAADARAWYQVPRQGDDKYRRGVLGMITGSEEFPGAAVLGAEAAMRTGVGMVRYLGPRRASDFVLARRPEVVTTDGRVQAWLIGSGVDAAHRSDDVTARMRAALGQGVPVIIDAGALDLATEARCPVVVTPHHGELVRLLGGAGVEADVAEVGAAPGEWAARAAETLGVVVLLKGPETHVVAPGGPHHVLREGPHWLATAGTGDVLAGILGALMATGGEHAATREGLAALAATAVHLHGRAGVLAGGPLAALDVAEAVPGAVRDLIAGR